MIRIGNMTKVEIIIMNMINVLIKANVMENTKSIIDKYNKNYNNQSIYFLLIY